MATLLGSDFFHAEMAILGLDPFQTSSTIWRVIWISSAIRTICMFGKRPFTSPYKVRNRNIWFKDWNQNCCHSNIKICTMCWGTILIAADHNFNSSPILQHISSLSSVMCYSSKIAPSISPTHGRYHLHFKCRDLHHHGLSCTLYEDIKFLSSFESRCKFMYFFNSISA